MNNTSWILLLFLVISLGENVYFYQNNSNLSKVIESMSSTKTASTADDDFLTANMNNQEIAKAYFNVGYERAKTGETEQSSCEFEKTHRKFYCQQGYYFATSAQEITNNKTPKSLNMKDYKFAVKEMSIGMAAATLDKPADKTSPYQVDGWSYMKASKNRSFRNNIIESCAKEFPQDTQKYCQWGAGRAISFLGQNAIAPSSDNKISPEGTNFSLTFMGALEDANKTNLEEKNARTSAFLIMNQFSDKKNKIAKSPGWSKCLSEKHVSDCL